MLTDAERLLVGRWYRTFFRYTVYMTPSPLSSPHKRHVGCKVENRTSNLVMNVRINERICKRYKGTNNEGPHTRG
ncbi:hypothetical protein ALC57_06574 [Trachymyrmex cornetzi]|uniref:Uncharacterized protein n=1 Tax=Trachymyrmex cornetzi TaxID=471704 RepID=A0A151J8B2_9HYME|nr:hypothetical protein ALC57_06574 [Trachymyrmex cornetzi]